MNLAHIIEFTICNYIRKKTEQRIRHKAHGAACVL